MLPAFASFVAFDTPAIAVPIAGSAQASDTAASPQRPSRAYTPALITSAPSKNRPAISNALCSH